MYAVSGISQGIQSIDGIVSMLEGTSWLTATVRLDFIN